MIRGRVDGYYAELSPSAHAESVPSVVEDQSEAYAHVTFNVVAAVHDIVLPETIRIEPIPSAEEHAGITGDYVRTVREASSRRIRKYLEDAPGMVDQAPAHFIRDLGMLESGWAMTLAAQSRETAYRAMLDELGADVKEVRLSGSERHLVSASIARFWRSSCEGLEGQSWESPGHVALVGEEAIEATLPPRLAAEARTLTKAMTSKPGHSEEESPRQTQ